MSDKLGETPPPANEGRTILFQDWTTASGMRARRKHYEEIISRTITTKPTPAQVKGKFPAEEGHTTSFNPLGFLSEETLVASTQGFQKRFTLDPNRQFDPSWMRKGKN